MTDTPPDRNHGKHVCTWAQHPPTPSFLGKRAPAAEFAGAQADEATATCKVGAFAELGKGSRLAHASVAESAAPLSIEASVPDVSARHGGA